MINSYEIFGTAAYFNGSIYLGVTPTSANAPGLCAPLPYSSAGLALVRNSYASPDIQENTRGTTPFISANGTSDGILWMIDRGPAAQRPRAHRPAQPSAPTMPQSGQRALQQHHELRRHARLSASSSPRPSWPTARCTSPPDMIQYGEQSPGRNRCLRLEVKQHFLAKPESPQPPG